MIASQKRSQGCALKKLSPGQSRYTHCVPPSKEKLWSVMSLAQRGEKTSLPINLQADLHLARVIDLIGHHPERVVVQVVIARAEDRPVEQVEDFPAEIQPEVFSEAE